MTQFVWTCARCARSVPNRLDACRCGSSRGDIPAEALEPLPVPPIPPPLPTAATSRRIAGVNRTVFLAVAAVLFIVLTQVFAYFASREPPRRTPPSAAALAARVPASDPEFPAMPPLDEAPPSAHSDTIAAAAALEPMSLLSTEEIVTRSMPAVVTVQTRQGIGSGFFVAPDTVITNAHVISGNAMVTLKRGGGYSRAARVDEVWDAIDLAILKVDLPDLDQTVLPLALPSDVHVGGDVVAIGSPLGLANSVTRGIVSAMRDIDGVTVIQTDAAINPGNSGGPLLDRYGRVLGVNTMKLSARGIESLAFAVSVQYVRKLLGAGFAPKAYGTREREDGMREYAQNVRILAQQADAVEVNWKKFHAYCAPEGEAPVVERGWFALADGRRATMRDSGTCRSWHDYFKESAVKTHDALRRFHLSARAAGVDVDQLRVIRRRHSMIWAAWEP
jgi:S1-C subfamily serine protease